MARGRPPLYKTAEEKLQANRDKARRSYEKRKDEINRRKCEKRRELNPELAAKKPLPPLKHKSRKEKGIDPVKFWMKRTDKVPGLFQELLEGRSPPKFLTQLAKEYEANHRNGASDEDCQAQINHYLREIGILQAKLSRYFERFLNIVGLGDETNHVNEIAADIRRVELSLQDLLVNIMSDPDRVALQIRQGKLTFG